MVSTCGTVMSMVKTERPRKIFSSPLTGRGLFGSVTQAPSAGSIAMASLLMTRAHRVARLLCVFGQFVVADAGIAVHANVTLCLFVIPIQLLRLFPLRTLVCSIAERQCAGEPAAANVLGFAADGHRIGLVAKALDESRHDRSFKVVLPNSRNIRRTGHTRDCRSPGAPLFHFLQGLQVLDEVVLLSPRQPQPEKPVVVIHHVEQRGKAAVVKKPALLVRPEPLQRRGPVVFVWRPVRLK